jgi:long-chain fatty acid transport protein
MKKNMKIVAALMAIGMVSPMAYATNGDEMMAVGTENTALGGTGVAHYTGAESAFANPAMLGQSNGDQLNVGIVMFMPNVKNTGALGLGATPPTMATSTEKATSDAKTSYIPDISYSSRMSDSLTWGIAMAGIAGMGVDYTSATGSAPNQTYFKAKTTLSILDIIPTIAYNTKEYGIGFSPVLQYGSLAISYNTGAATNPDHNADTNTGFGYSLGGYFNPMPALTLAAAYQSSIAHSYGKQLSTAGTGFGQVFADNLDQPAQMKAGVSYTFAQNYTVTADYKSIQWSSAKGYKEFGWKDQSVMAVGAKYAGQGYWLGLGYNSSDNPIGTIPNGTLTPSGNNGGVVNMFNNLMFPATIKESITLGGGYSISKATDIDFAYVNSPEVKTTVDISDAAQSAPGTVSNTTTHSQQSFSVSMRFKF